MIGVLTAPENTGSEEKDMSFDKLALTTEAVIDKYGDMVYRVAVSATGRREDAEDVFQEVFLRLVRYRHKLSSEEHLKAWLLRVTVNCARKQHGSAWRRKVQYFEESDWEEPMDVNAQRAYEQIENGDSPIMAAMKQLPEGYRVAIYLFYYEELSIAQIGKLLDEKESTVKSRLYRGRELLRRSLADGARTE